MVHLAAMDELLPRLLEVDDEIKNAVFKALFLSSDNAIGISRNGVRISANPAHVKLFGYDSEQELLQRPVLESIHPDDRALFLDCIQRRKMGLPAPNPYRVRAFRKDGSLFDMELGVIHFSVSEDRYSVVQLRDVSFEKPVEAAIRGQKEFYRAVFELNTALKFIIDPATGEIVDVNTPVCLFYGYSYEKLRSMRIHDINIAPEAEVSVALRDCSVRSRSSFNMKHRLASGEIRDVDVYSGPIELDGRRLLFSIIHDVTDRKRLEDQLHQAQKMEAVGQLAGGIAHDFNNLLTAVMGNAELIAEQSGPGTKFYEAAEDILRIATRAEELTRQLLAFSRRQILQPTVLNINEVVRESSKLLKRVIGEHIRFEIVLDPDAGMIRADPGQLELMIMNLLVNARDAMPEGGTLRVSTASGEGPKGRETRLQVQDSGVGMSAEVKAHIFEPFFTTKDSTKGTGLGLASVYWIVQQSGGHIEVESQPGEGALFTVSLPRVDARASTAASEKVTAPRVHARPDHTILVVEDEEDVRSILVETLRLRGYQVLQASCADEAILLAQVHAGEIHVLITDLRMPGMNGKDLAEKLLKSRPMLRTVLISGYSDGLVTAGCLAALRAVFLQKPFKAQTLAKTIESVIDYTD